jgi:hypothetical protein
LPTPPFGEVERTPSSRRFELRPIRVESLFPAVITGIALNVAAPIAGVFLAEGTGAWALVGGAVFVGWVFIVGALLELRVRWSFRFTARELRIERFGVWRRTRELVDSPANVRCFVSVLRRSGGANAGRGSREAFALAVLGEAGTRELGLVLDRRADTERLAERLNAALAWAQEARSSRSSIPSVYPSSR